MVNYAIMLAGLMALVAASPVPEADAQMSSYMGGAGGSGGAGAMGGAGGMAHPHFDASKMRSGISNGIKAGKPIAEKIAHGIAEHRSKHKEEMAHKTAGAAVPYGTGSSAMPVNGTCPYAGPAPTVTVTITACPSGAAADAAETGMLASSAPKYESGKGEEKPEGDDESEEKPESGDEGEEKPESDEESEEKPDDEAEEKTDAAPKEKASGEAKATGY